MYCVNGVGKRGREGGREGGGNVKKKTLCKMLPEKRRRVEWRGGSEGYFLRSKNNVVFCSSYKVRGGNKGSIFPYCFVLNHQTVFPPSFQG